MRLYRGLLRLYPASFRREYGDEMAAHLPSPAARRQRRGRRASALWLAAIAEVLRNAAIVHWDILRQDLRYIARTLRRAPGLRDHGRARSSRSASARTPRRSRSPTSCCSARCRSRSPTGWSRSGRRSRRLRPDMELSPANYRDWKAAATSFDGSAPIPTSRRICVAQRRAASGSRARLVTADFFAALGVQPALGRALSGATDDQRHGAAGQPVLLSYASVADAVRRRSRHRRPADRCSTASRTR